MLDPSIFKAYDIRGIYPTQIDEEGAYNIGRAIASYVNVPQIIVGYDMRVSANSISEALMRGIMDHGISVIDIGMVTTDAVYYACKKYDTAGIMNTASHNPPEYTGFKIVKKLPQLIGKGSGMEELQELALKGSFPKTETEGMKEEDNTIISEYIKECLSFIEKDTIPKMKIVIDAGNGMGGVISHETFQHFPQLEIIPLFFEPDGTFPNHVPDPLKPENKKILEEKVLSENGDLGIAFDGDADRCFFVDNSGYSIPGDFITALFGGWFCQKEPGAKILYDPRASDVVVDTIQESGGIPLVERVGHTFIKKRMAEENAIFAGEVSAHYYYRDLGYFDSGILSAMLLLQIIGEKKQKLSEIIQPFLEKYFLSGEINSKVSSVQEKLDAIEAKYHDAEITKIDGISIRYSDFHFNVRGSNTEPVLRLNLEGKTRQIMENKRDELLELIRS